jgi:hypothetical protein
VQRECSSNSVALDAQGRLIFLNQKKNSRLQTHPDRLHQITRNIFPVLLSEEQITAF